MEESGWRRVRASVGALERLLVEGEVRRRARLIRRVVKAMVVFRSFVVDVDVDDGEMRWRRARVRI